MSTLKRHEPIIIDGYFGSVGHGINHCAAATACTCGWYSERLTPGYDAARQVYDREHGVFIWEPAQ